MSRYVRCIVPKYLLFTLSIAAPGHLHFQSCAWNRIEVSLSPVLFPCFYTIIVRLFLFTKSALFLLDHVTPSSFTYYYSFWGLNILQTLTELCQCWIDIHYTHLTIFDKCFKCEMMSICRSLMRSKIASVLVYDF